MRWAPLFVLLLAGCGRPAVESPRPAAPAEKKEAEGPEVRFHVFAKPTTLVIERGQQVEPTVVLHWKIRSHWAKGADPEVGVSAKVEPAGRGVRAVVREAKVSPPPAAQEGETPVGLTIGAATDAAGEYVVEVSAAVAGAEPRRATIRVRVRGE